MVPPRESAVPWEEGHPRNRALEGIAQHGRKGWKKIAGYHRRSLAENAMHRLKQLFGDRLASRLFETQVTEVHARVAAMNIMALSGPKASLINYLRQSSGCFSMDSADFGGLKDPVVD